MTLHITLTTDHAPARAIALLRRLLARKCFRDVTITTEGDQ